MSLFTYACIFTCVIVIRYIPKIALPSTRQATNRTEWFSRLRVPYLQCLVFAPTGKEFVVRREMHTEYTGRVLCERELEHLLPATLRLPQLNGVWSNVERKSDSGWITGDAYRRACFARQGPHHHVSGANMPYHGSVLTASDERNNCLLLCWWRWRTRRCHWAGEEHAVGRPRHLVRIAARFNCQVLSVCEGLQLLPGKRAPDAQSPQCTALGELICSPHVSIIASDPPCASMVPSWLRAIQWNLPSELQSIHVEDARSMPLWSEHESISRQSAFRAEFCFLFTSFGYILAHTQRCLCCEYDIMHVWLRASGPYVAILI